MDGVDGTILYTPCSGPCPCTSIQGSKGTCSQPQRRSAPGSGVRAVGTGCRGTSPSTDSPLSITVRHRERSDLKVRRTSASSHRPEQVRVDLYDLPHGPARCVRVSIRISDADAQEDRPMYEPAVARESTATMTPPWKRNASVVVPCWILIRHDGSAWSSVCRRRNAAGYAPGQPLHTPPCGQDGDAHRRRRARRTRAHRARGCQSPRRSPTRRRRAHRPRPPRAPCAARLRGLSSRIARRACSCCC
jgi:hypothetical protein